MRPYHSRNAEVCQINDNVQSQNQNGEPAFCFKLFAFCFYAKLTTTRKAKTKMMSRLSALCFKLL